MKKLISILLLFCLLSGSLPVSAFMENADAFFWSLEAEAFAHDTTVTDGQFRQIGDKTASGSYSMGGTTYAGEDQNPNERPLSATLTVPADGDYKVYFRFKGTGTAARYILYSFDGAAYQIVQFAMPNTNTWTWGMLSVTLKAGEHTLAFSNCRAGFYLDKVIMTDSLLYFPIGTGQDLETEGNGWDQMYPAPTVYPTKGQHPRVLINQSDVNRLKANLDHWENKAAYEEMQELAALDKTGILRDVDYNNYDWKAVECAESNALLYLLTGEDSYADKAVTIMTNYLNTVKYTTTSVFRDRGISGTIFSASLVYDWCWGAPSFTDARKEALITAVATQASLIGCGWPPVKFDAYGNGQGWEESLIRDMFAFSIATYDELPEIYACVGGRVLNDFVPVANTHYGYGSTFHRMGDNYGPYRFEFEVVMTMLLKGMGRGNLISANQQWMGYQLLYRRRPDDGTFQDGDIWEKAGSDVTALIPLAFELSCLYQDTYMKQLFSDWVADPSTLTHSDGGDYRTLSVPIYLALNDVSVGRSQRSELPLSHFSGAETGIMTARTGWDTGKGSNTMMVSMKLPERYYASHSHLDAGHFEIYYKGPLALDSGFYDSFGSLHDYNYNKRTIAHNSMLIYKEGETDFGFGTAGGDMDSNDGGQRKIYKYPSTTTLTDYQTLNKAGTVISYDFGDDLNAPSYTYMRGDMTNWYSTEKIENFERSFLFYNFFDDTYPGALIVFDKVKSDDASYKKTWLLHSQEEPTIVGNTATFARTKNSYNGRLVNETLLPADATIKKVGGTGKEYLVGDTNYPPQSKHSDGVDESGKWRIEVSPDAANAEDYFLNVIQVSDNDNSIVPLDATMYEDDKFYGVRIKDKAAYFTKATEKLSETFMISATGEGTLEYTLCGLAAGTWQISDGSKVVAEKQVTDTGAVLNFTAEAGTYSITKTSNTFTAKDLSILANLKKPVIPSEYVRITKDTDFEETIKSNLYGKYYLAEDIELPSTYEPIADFAGELISDKDNPKSIKLNITKDVLTVIDKGKGIGLFANLLDGAKIENLRLTGSVTVTGAMNTWIADSQTYAPQNGVYVGALFGVANGGYTTNPITVNNIVNEATITISNGISGQIGGIAGRIYNATGNYVTSTLTNLVNYGAITQEGKAQLCQIGGIAGVCQAKLENCENYGNVTATNGNAAGICYNCVESVLTNCYNAGDITADIENLTGEVRYAAGIAYNGSNGTITECYNIGTVSAYTITSTFQITNPSAEAPRVTNCGYVGSTANTSDTQGTSMTLEKMMTELTGKASDEFMAALVLKGYTKIVSAADFEQIRSNPKGKYYLAEDIELPSTYEPIADFAGELISDENNPKSIKLNINKNLSSSANIGLFANVKSGVKIKNIKLTGSVTVSGSASKVYVGALFGNYVDYTTTTFEISNVVNEASITLNGAVAGSAGGIFGRAYSNNTSQFASFALTGLINKGNVSQIGTGASVTLGGIAGLSGAQLCNCENYGTISAPRQYAAGIVGNSYALTTNCYNMGTVSAGYYNSKAAGIAAILSGSGAAVTGCYNIGTISATGNGTPAAYQIAPSATNSYYLDLTETDTNEQAMTLEEMRVVQNLPAEFAAVLNHLRKVIISSADEKMGTMSPNGIQYVQTGDTLIVRVNPSEGYRVAKVEMNGVEMVANAEGTYTLTITQDNTTVVGTFEGIPPIEPSLSLAVAHPLSDGSVSFGGIAQGYGYTITDWGMIYSTDANRTTNVHTLSGNKVRLNDKGQFGIRMTFSEVPEAYYMTPYVTYWQNNQPYTVYGDTIHIQQGGE